MPLWNGLRNWFCAWGMMPPPEKPPIEPPTGCVERRIRSESDDVEWDGNPAKQYEPVETATAEDFEKLRRRYG
jgi:hypothetical protein